MRGDPDQRVKSKHHRELIGEIEDIHSQRDMKSYGSPRVHVELVERGKSCSLNGDRPSYAGQFHHKVKRPRDWANTWRNFDTQSRHVKRNNKD